jgi:hypothetical protein
MEIFTEEPEWSRNYLIALGYDISNYVYIPRHYIRGMYEMFADYLELSEFVICQYVNHSPEYCSLLARVGLRHKYGLNVYLESLYLNSAPDAAYDSALKKLEPYLLLQQL